MIINKNWEEKLNSILWNDIYSSSEYKSRPMSPELQEKLEEFIKLSLVREYRDGYNQCLKDQKLTGESYQHLYL